MRCDNLLSIPEPDFSGCRTFSRFHLFDDTDEEKSAPIFEQIRESLSRKPDQMTEEISRSLGFTIHHTCSNLCSMRQRGVVVAKMVKGKNRWRLVG
jgi:hypothetical protein